MGAFFIRCGGSNLSGAARQLPLTRGALGTGVEKPPLVKGRCRAERDGEVVTNLRQPLSQPAADSSPERGAFARRGGVTSQALRASSP